MGYLPRTFTPNSIASQTLAADKRLKYFTEIRDEAAASMKSAAQIIRDQSHTPIITWPIRTKVWLEGKNITTTHPSAKLAPKQWGPFPITAVINPVTFKLELLHQWKIHPVFHASLLHPYKETMEHRPNFINPPPDLVG